MTRLNRRKKRPAWAAIPLWSAMTLFAGWGVWQFSNFRQKLMAEVQPSRAAAAGGSGAAASSPSDPGDQVETLMLDDSRSNDPWADATTPVLGISGAGGAGGTATAGATPGAEARTPDEWMALASTLLNEGKIPQGRAALNAALQALGNDARAPLVRRQLTTLNEGVFLGSAIVPEDPAAPFVEIRPGDSFLKFARQYAVPAGLLEKLNPNLNPRNLKPETGVKIVQGPFHLRFSKADHRLDLYVRDLYVKSMGAEVEEGNYLPRGVYRMKAASKIEVGSRQWIGFEGTGGETQDITIGWIYGSAGPRLGRNRGLPAGVKVRDEDLRQLYNALMETRSLLKVEP
jgi:hypothetical protein